MIPSLDPFNCIIIVIIITTTALLELDSLNEIMTKNFFESMFYIPHYLIAFI